MNIKHFTAVLLLSVSLTAGADFQTVSEAYEVSLADMQVPATPSSGIVFKECADCETQILRVTTQTAYLVNGRPVSLQEFRKQVFQVRDRRNKMIIVKHHLESDTVESVAVSL